MRSISLFAAGLLLAVSAQGAMAQEAKPAALGVQLNDMDDPGKVLVQKIMPGLTGAAIGIREGDQVVAIGGTPVTNADQVVEFMQKAKAGDAIAVTVRRGDQQMELSGIAAPRPEGMETGRLRIEAGGE